MKSTSVKTKRCVTALLLLLWFNAVWSAQVRLITIGPGDAFWSAFGHTAIAIDEQVYGFGYFSFSDDLALDFVQNKMHYDLGLSELNREAQLAKQQQRAFSVIDLSFNDQQLQQLQDHLNHHYLPENRSYPYDYFTNNCATKIRDLLNEASGGKLKANSQTVNGTTYQHMTFPANNQGLMNFGLAMGYGWDAYVPKTDWELMAFPVFLESAVNQYLGDLSHEPQLLIADQIEFSWLSTHWALWLYVAVFSALLGLKATQKWSLRLFVYLQAVIGLVLLSLWLLTPHTVADWNFNVLLFSPLGFWVFGRKHSHNLLLIGWLVWAILAAYLGAWYLYPVLIPCLLAWFNLQAHHQES